MLRHEVEILLAARDQGVLDKDPEIFLSSQFGEIHESKSEGYLALDKLASKLIAVHEDETNPNHIVALVKEIYWRKGHLSHQGYLLFYLRRDPTGSVKIQNIAWSNSELSPQ